VTGTPVRIDVISDVVCPWCAIGLAAMEQALDRIGDAAAPEVVFHPLQLNPGTPPEGEAIVDNLARKYGLTPEQASGAGGRIRAAAAEVGVTMAGRRDRLFDTFDAHRLLHWAQATGRQAALKHALLDAYFERGENVSDADVLVAAADRAGLDPEEARRVIADGRFADEVTRDEDHWRGEGILSVPTFILDGRFVIQGAQSADRMEKALRRLIETGIAA
jgi:predicted DsbA family dithiol-disulfide isomerase